MAQRPPGRARRQPRGGGLEDPALPSGTKDLLWYEEVAIFGRQEAQSYSAYKETERRFGLGHRERVDVGVEFYPSHEIVEQKGSRADQSVLIRQG